MTAATNAMEVEASKAVDVFTYLGDASASGADEVGIAMQRASSSALEAGVSFEWLGAMVATVSEKTRLQAEVIGTSFNAMFSRYQSIKTKGYNEEDETKINDIAKALDTIDVKIIDGANNWKSFSGILQEVALQWDGLDGKTKAYITTALAGSRQRDRLLALLNDMAKGAEGGSRAFELYAGAMEAAGESNAKYAIWLESVKAAQDGFANSQERLQAALMPATAIKGYYDGFAGLLDMFTLGIEKTDGWTLKLPALIAGVGGLYVAVTRLGPALKSIFMGGLSMSKIGLIVGALGAIASLVTIIAGKTLPDKLPTVDESLAKMVKVDADYAPQISQLESLKSRYVELSGQTKLTAEQQKELDAVLKEIARFSPALRDSILDETGAYRDQETVVRELTAAMSELQDAKNREKRLAADDVFTAVRNEIIETEKSVRSLQRVMEFSDFLSKNNITDSFAYLYGSNSDWKDIPGHLKTMGYGALSYWNSEDLNQIMLKLYRESEDSFAAYEAKIRELYTNLRDSLAAFVQQNGFDVAGEGVQAMLNQMLEGVVSDPKFQVVDPNGDYTKQIALQLQESAKAILANPETIAIINEWYELVSMTVDKNDTELMAKRNARLNELANPVNHIFSDLGIDYTEIVSSIPAIEDTEEALDDLAVAGYEATEAQNKLVESAQAIVNELHAEAAAVDGFRQQ